MEPTSATPATPQQTSLDSLRRRRAELREAMSDLEAALAAPVAGTEEPWPDRVRAALDALAADFATHVEITEGPDGLYHEVLATAPRLADAVAHLTKEHTKIRGLVDAAHESVSAPEADVERVREQGTELLGRLVRHRQRGSDLVYEAYEFDIGGDT
jgi:Hemerythrin HHE cation binding domain